jgi:hypothetical protein
MNLLNNLFQEETIWKDLNETHKLGTALEHESVCGGDSVTNHTITSSLSDFWEVMNQRYVYPEETIQKNDRTTSILRNKLLSATAQSRLINSAYNTPSSQRNPSSSSVKRMKIQTSEGRGNRTTPSSLRNTREHLQTQQRQQQPKLKPFLLKSPPRGLSSSAAATSTSASGRAMPPPDAIVPDYLVHLDPLSLSVTTTLKGLGKLEGDQKQKRKLSYQSDLATGEDDEMTQPRRDRTASYDTTTDDHTVHSANTSWDEESAAYTNQSTNHYFLQNDKRFQNKQKISAEKLKDMTFMRNFFLQKATLADTHDLIARMQVLLLPRHLSASFSLSLFVSVYLSVSLSLS